MRAIILAGGSGKRLWPLSRENYPKQFLSINSRRTLLQETVERAKKYADDILLVTGERQYFQALYQLEDLGIKDDSIITEPVSRNTAPAILLACLHSMENGRGENLLVLPSDHIISEEFFDTVRGVEDHARDYLITFGIRPDRPATGYGYIRFGESLGGCFRVREFTEKPSQGKAERFLAEGDYLWNSGIFLFNAPLLLEEFRKHLPEVYSRASTSQELIENYAALPDVSIDYGIMEKSSKVAVAPFKGLWHDMGSWKSVYDILPKDSRGNAFRGRTITLDTANTLIFGGERLVSTIGLEDMVIVDTPDALFIADKSNTQEVKRVIEKLKRENYPEYREGVTVYRPWGHYTTLEKGERHKVKRLSIYPGRCISYQLHHHRAEHWIVVRGTAKVTRDGEEVHIHENESTYIPPSTRHRLENPGKVNLHIIETQTGEYIEEDDIVRLEDDYGRK